MNRLPLLGLIGLCSLIMNVDLHFHTVLADELSPSRTSMFNEQWLDTVVSIEQLAQQKQPDGTTKMVPTPIGTGFMVVLLAANVMEERQSRARCGSGVASRVTSAW